MQASSTSEERARSWRSAATVVVALVAATAVSAALDGVVSLTSQAMVYLFAVVATAYVLERVAAIVCAVGAVTALNFFFVPPRYTLTVESRDNLIALAAMLAVALLVSTLSAALKRQTTAARASAMRARQLRELAAELIAADSESEALSMGREAFAQAFAGPLFVAAVRNGRLDDVEALPE